VALKRKLPWTLSFCLLALILDLASKRLAVSLVGLGGSIEVGAFFNLVLVMNSGAAFSLLSGAGEGQGLKMAALALAAMIPLGILYRMALPEDKLELASLGLIFGGALGNIHDRIRFDAVVDFLDLHIGDRHWPAFNVADIAVVLGLLLFVLSLILKARKAKGQGPARGQAPAKGQDKTKGKGA
jgi:signal peptidase II